MAFCPVLKAGALVAAAAPHHLAFAPDLHEWTIGSAQAFGQAKAPLFALAVAAVHILTGFVYKVMDADGFPPSLTFETLGHLLLFPLLSFEH